MSEFLPLYTNEQQVKSYLTNKALWDNPDSTMSSLKTSNIIKFIVDAEVEVERELSKQYVIPFQTTTGQPFNMLPRTTQILVQNLCSYLSSIKILRIYFGKSEGVRGHEYVVELERMYEEALTNVILKDKRNQYRGTPLTGMKLNTHASYRSDSGIPAPLGTEIARNANNSVNTTRNKLANLNKSIYFGWNRNR